MLGLGLAAALVGIGFGLVCWAKYLDLDEHVVQQREPLQISPAAEAELHDEIETAGEIFGRRKLLLVLFGGSFASLVVGFVGPIGSLGPKPRGERGRTSWTAGSRLVTTDGTADRGRRDDATTSSSPCSPRATSASTTRRSCCCACRRRC